MVLELGPEALKNADTPTPRIQFCHFGVKARKAIRKAGSALFRRDVLAHSELKLIIPPITRKQRT